MAEPAKTQDEYFKRLAQAVKEGDRTTSTVVLQDARLTGSFLLSEGSKPNRCRLVDLLDSVTKQGSCDVLRALLEQVPSQPVGPEDASRKQALREVAHRVQTDPEEAEEQSNTDAARWLVKGVPAETLGGWYQNEWEGILEVAAEKRSAGFVKLLVEGLRLEDLKRAVPPAVLRAAESSPRNMACLIDQTLEIDQSALPGTGWTKRGLLMLLLPAVCSGNVAWVERLMSRMMELELCERDWVKTALQLAVRRSSGEVVWAIIAKLPLEEWVQEEVDSALMIAVRRNSASTVGRVAREAPDKVSTEFLVAALREQNAAVAELISALTPRFKAKVTRRRQSGSSIRHWVPPIETVQGDTRVRFAELDLSPGEGSKDPIVNNPQPQFDLLKMHGKSWCRCRQRLEDSSCWSGRWRSAGKQLAEGRWNAYQVPMHLWDSREVIGALAVAPDDAALCKPFAVWVVGKWWQGIAGYYYVDTALNIVHIVAAIVLTHDLRYENPTQTFFVGVVFALAVKDALDELFEVLLFRGEYFTQMGNWMDLFRVVLETAALTIVWGAVGTLSIWRKGTAAAWVAALWFHFLADLRGYRVIGLQTLPLLKAVLASNVLSLAIVIGFAVMAATHAYYVLGVRNEPSFWYAALLQVYRLGVMGDFDLFELEGQDTNLVAAGDDVWEPSDPVPSDEYISVHILFFTVSLGIAVVLMNLLIGVLSGNYEKLVNVADAIFLRERAKLVVQYQVAALPRLVASLKRCASLQRCWGPTKRELEKGSTETKTWKQVVVFTPAEDFEEETSEEKLCDIDKLLEEADLPLPSADTVQLAAS